MGRLLAASLCLGLLLLVSSSPLAAQTSGGKPDDGDNAPDGLKALKHSDPQVRFNAVMLLGKLGKTAKFAVPQLKELLQDPSVAVRIKVAESLWKIEQPDPKPLLDVLVAACEHKEDVVRAAALNVIGQIGEKAKPALPAVKKGLRDKEFNVRLQAVFAAGAMGPVAKGAVPELLDVIRQDDTGFLEAQVTIALKKVGPGAVPALRKGLSDKSPKVRRAAAFSLGLLGPKAYEAVPELTKALTDDETLVRVLAAEALGKIGTEAEPALPALKTALKDKEAAVRINAALALVLISADTAALDVLATAVVKGANADTRQSAAAALAKAGPLAKAAIPQLTTALKDTDAEVRRQVLITLGGLGPAAGSTDKIKPLLNDKNQAVRFQAVTTIWEIDHKVSDQELKVLEKALKQDDTGEVLQALQILSDLGPAAKLSAPAVAALLKHDDKQVRGAAAQTLKKIDPGALKKGTK
jgi:HEAT repeat protein